MKFILELTTGGTVEDYRDVAAVLRNLADELEEPADGGTWTIDVVHRGSVYEDGIGVRNRTTIGQWRIAQD